MVKICTALLTFIIQFSFSQDFKKEINDQVWKPFITSFSNNDTNGFMAVHSKDLVRCSRDDGALLDWNAYEANNRKGNDRAKASNRKKSIELHFIERVATETQALDVGIYKTTYFRPDGSTDSFYGKFLVVLRKENGIWKILVDTDSSENGTINAQSFLSARSME